MTATLARRWGGSVRRADLDKWVETYRDRVVPRMRAMAGWRGVSFLSAQSGDPCRVSVTTFWEDENALRQFSGDDLTSAIVPDFIKGFFVECDPKSVLYNEIFVETV